MSSPTASMFGAISSGRCSTTSNGLRLSAKFGIVAVDRTTFESLQAISALVRRATRKFTTPSSRHEFDTPIERSR